LLLTLACVLALPSIHPMALPLAGAIGLHMLLRHRHTLWQARLGVAAVLALAGVSNSGYVAFVVERASEFWNDRGTAQTAAHTVADWTTTQSNVAEPSSKVDHVATQPSSAQRELAAPKSKGGFTPHLRAALFPLLGGRLF